MSSEVRICVKIKEKDMRFLPKCMKYVKQSNLIVDATLKLHVSLEDLAVMTVCCSLDAKKMWVKSEDRM